MDVEKIVSSVANFLERIMPFLSLISITVNLFHVIVLTRKTVTSSSMNTLLIGIAIVDILSPMLYIKRGIDRILDNFEDFWYYCSFL
uniref:G_PROTEIN_RECEP_F1_2 domain-containing protein n=1 Tax=Caenorhabditis tropicalis TaxID=1561998 RepID=A0A1I7THB5_9PELO